MTRIEQLRLELAAVNNAKAKNTNDPIGVRLEESLRTYVRDYRTARLEMLIRVAKESQI